MHDTLGVHIDDEESEEAARHEFAQTANAALTTLYWQIGMRVRTEVLEGRRAEYGAQIVAAVGRALEARYGAGFGEKSLRHMLRFVEVFPDDAIVSALRRQLSSRVRVPGGARLGVAQGVGFASAKNSTRRASGA
ncbi:MAG: DUF1016 N-terminal domain-containing protein [Polyangiaceae bacterium]